MRPCQRRYLLSSLLWLGLLCPFSVVAEIQFLLLDGIDTGEQFCLVGEQGQVVTGSPATGWDIHSTNVDVLLTSITQTPTGRLVVVGHDSVILISDDNGVNWQTVYKDPEFEAPLLDVISTGEGILFAVGAYGQLIKSTDNGDSWAIQELNLEHELTEEETGFLELNDLHLNRVHLLNNGNLLIATEAGYLFQSDDLGAHWKVHKSPYEGSFFGIETIDENQVIVYGLRGHVFRWQPLASAWQKVATGTNELLQSSTVTENGNIIIAGYGSSLLVSDDQAQSFTEIVLDIKANLTHVLVSSDGEIIISGDHGITHRAFAELIP